MLLRCHYSSNWPKTQCNFYQNPKYFFGQVDPKILIEMQMIKNTQGNLEKEQSWRVYTSIKGKVSKIYIKLQ